MSITIRELLQRCLWHVEKAAETDGVDRAHAADTKAHLHRFLTPRKGDKVAVDLDPGVARSLLHSMHSGPGLTDAEWEAVTGAVHEALSAYDGPDGDDGRAFTNAKGEPFYEP